MGVVGLLAGGIDHHADGAVLAVARPPDHQVVAQATIVVHELGVALLAGLEAEHVGGHQRLEGRGGGLEATVEGNEPRDPHMADVEQARVGARMHVFLEDAGAVLDRQLIAGEFDHAAAIRHVPIE